MHLPICHPTIPTLSRPRSWWIQPSKGQRLLCYHLRYSVILSNMPCLSHVFVYVCSWCSSCYVKVMDLPVEQKSHEIGRLPRNHSGEHLGITKQSPLGKCKQSLSACPILAHLVNKSKLDVSTCSIHCAPSSILSKFSNTIAFFHRPNVSKYDAGSFGYHVPALADKAVDSYRLD